MDNDNFIALTEVAMEYAALKNEDHCPKGLYVIPSPESALLWDAVLFVHQGECSSPQLPDPLSCWPAENKGYYADSVLKFRIQFPSEYPSRIPEVKFTTDVFHPLISQKDGSLNLSLRFHQWRCVSTRSRRYERTVVMAS